MRRWARTETLTGELRGILPGGAHPPAADSTYKEGGAYGEFAAAVGLRPGTSASAGRRARRGDGPPDRARRARHWYDRIDGETAGQLGVVLGALQRHDAAQAAFEVTTVHGRPVELRVSAAARVHGELAPPGPVSSLADLGTRLAGVTPSPGGHGRRLEAEVSLDLTDPANLAAVQGVVQMLGLRRRPPTGRRVRALAARLDADGAVDVRVFRERLTRARSARTSGPAPASGGLRPHAEARDLLAAWSLRSGGRLQEREDCVPRNRSARAYS